MPICNMVYYKRGGASSLGSLCFTANQANSTIGIYITGSPAVSSVWYSRDGQTWAGMTGNVAYTVANVGDKFYIKGNNPNGWSTDLDNWCNIGVTGDMSVTGNVMALLDNGTGTMTTIPNNYCFLRLFIRSNITSVGNILTAGTLKPFCYRDMFWRDSAGGVATVSPNLLPAMTTVESCYQGMFVGNTSLTAAPNLPATNTAVNCYAYMFANCTGLTSVPTLPATTLTDACYYQMFLNCSSLTTLPANMIAATGTAGNYACCEMFKGSAITVAPALNCSTLGRETYGGMFSNCTALQQAPALPAVALGQGCYQYMFYNCTSLTRIPSLPANTATQSCYWCMFMNCSNLGFSTTKTGAYQHCFRCPSAGILTTATDWNLNMFTGTATAGTINAPTADVYYYSNTDVYPDVAEPNFLCFTANTANSTVGFYKTGTPLASRVWYSTDGINWTGMTGNQSYTLASVGSKFYMKGYNPTGWSAGAENYWRINVTGNVSVTGSVMSLIDARGVTTTIPNSYCFNALFYGSTGITSVGNILTATTLTEACYRCMFLNCTNLTSVSTLPASTLANACYAQMFANCTNLRSTPYDMLPARTMTPECYRDMFRGCSRLTSYPWLQATVMATSCYQDMFNGCTSMTTAPSLIATSLAPWCYCGMFNSCSNILQPKPLFATDIPEGAYYWMYGGCSSMRMSATQHDEYQTAYRIPYQDTGTVGTNALYNMFVNVGGDGTMPATPTVNTTYYHE